MQRLLATCLAVMLTVLAGCFMQASNPPPDDQTNVPADGSSMDDNNGGPQDADGDGAPVDDPAMDEPADQPEGFEGVDPELFNFLSMLTAERAVPPTQSEALGSVGLFANTDGSKLAFALTIENITGLTSIQLHLGTEGEVGSLAVVLFEPESPVDGDLLIDSNVIVTAAALVGDLAGMPLSELVDRIEGGMAYITVITTEHPQGAIRGQIELNPENPS